MGNSSSFHDELGDYFPRTEIFLRLKNLGNTCYFNSIVQSLLHCSSVISFMKAFEEKTKLHGKQFTISETPFGQFVLLYRTFITSKLECTFIPESFIDSIVHQFPSFVKGEQHDAHELFICLIQSFDETLISINYKPLFSKIFQGSTEFSCSCLYCNNTAKQTDSFLSYSLGVQQGTSLTAQLRISQSNEYFQGTNRRFCSKCNIDQEFRTRLEVKESPQVLVFQMLRFMYDKNTGKLKKVQDHVPFPTALLFDYKKYNLSSVVVHCGSSLNFGHFLTLLHLHEKWIIASDMSLSVVGNRDVENFFQYGSEIASRPSVYLLFYEQSDTLA